MPFVALDVFGLEMLVWITDYCVQTCYVTYKNEASQTEITAHLHWKITHALSFMLNNAEKGKVWHQGLNLRPQIYSGGGVCAQHSTLLLRDTMLNTTQL